MRSCAPGSARRESGAPRASPGIVPRSRPSRCYTGSGIQRPVKWLSGCMTDRISVLVLLAGSRHDYLHMARPLLRALEATHHYDLKVTSDAEDLHLANGQVLLAASDHALQPGQAARVTEFVN